MGVAVVPWGSVPLGVCANNDDADAESKNASATVYARFFNFVMETSDLLN